MDNYVAYMPIWCESEDHDVVFPLGELIPDAGSTVIGRYCVYPPSCVVLLFARRTADKPYDAVASTSKTSSNWANSSTVGP